MRGCHDGVFCPVAAWQEFSAVYALCLHLPSQFYITRGQNGHDYSLVYAMRFVCTFIIA